MSISRRQLLAGGAAFATLAALRRLPFHEALACTPQEYGYGPLIPDPARILDLPEGFSYKVVSWMGDRMSDGFPTPSRYDGMASFRGEGGTTILVRNHEFGASTSSDNGVRMPLSQRYDAGKGGFIRGGTTNLVISEKNEVLAAYATLGGTVRNCAGGKTPWGTWITCEETTLTPEADSRHTKRHGYCFEVPASANEPIEPIPLKAMGRFSHEAVAVDPTTGFIYETEDANNSCFYRFIPFKFGEPKEGGVLEAMRLIDFPKGVNTDTNFAMGVEFEVDWFPIANVDPGPTETAVSAQALERGAANIRRGEGALWSRWDDAVYFVATDGGAARSGQIFRYRARGGHGQHGTIELFLESPAPDSGKSDDEWEWPDNLTTTPWGDLILCKDGPGTQYLYLITSEQKVIRFAKNALNGTEFAGATFGSDRQTFFVNIYGNDTLPGVTLAINGPWRVEPSGRSRDRSNSRL